MLERVPHDYNPYAYSNEEDLLADCRYQMVIKSGAMRLALACNTVEALAPLSGINFLPALIKGDYGLQLIQRTADAIGDMFIPYAMAGFSLDRENGVMVITNSPQGISREKFKHVKVSEANIGNALRLLKIKSEGSTINEFRMQLMEGFLAVAQMLEPLGIQRIEAIAADSHEEVLKLRKLPVNTEGEAAYIQERIAFLRRVMDPVYEACGFTRATKEDGSEYYYLDLE